jgi:hypothetical protein
MSNQNPTPSDGGPRLLDRVRDALRQRHYSYRTEQAYIHWIKRYIFFHSKKHPAQMGADEITDCLSFYLFSFGFLCDFALRFFSRTAINAELRQSPEVSRAFPNWRLPSPAMP